MIFEMSPPTLVAEGTRVVGDLTFFSGASIYGIVEGQLFQQSVESLQVGKSGWVQGAIVAQGPIVIEGRVDGDIRSSVKIQLSPSAVVRGKMFAPAIEVRPGAIVEGIISVERKTQRTLRIAA